MLPAPRRRARTSPFVPRLTFLLRFAIPSGRSGGSGRCRGGTCGGENRRCPARRSILGRCKGNERGIRGQFVNRVIFGKTFRRNLAESDRCRLSLTRFTN